MLKVFEHRTVLSFKNIFLYLANFETTLNELDLRCVMIVGHLFFPKDCISFMPCLLVSYAACWGLYVHRWMSSTQYARSWRLRWLIIPTWFVVSLWGLKTPGSWGTCKICARVLVLWEATCECPWSGPLCKLTRRTYGS